MTTSPTLTIPSPAVDEHKHWRCVGPTVVDPHGRTVVRDSSSCLQVRKMILKMGLPGGGRGDRNSARYHRNQRGGLPGSLCQFNKPSLRMTAMTWPAIRAMQTFFDQTSCPGVSGSAGDGPQSLQRSHAWACASQIAQQGRQTICKIPAWAMFTVRTLSLA